MLKYAISEISQYFNINVTDRNLTLTRKNNVPVPDEVILLIDEIKRYKQNVLYYLNNKKPEPKNICAVDIETDSKKFTDGQIKIIAVHGNNISFVTSNIEEARAMLSDESVLKVFHNSVFDVSWLEYHGYSVKMYTDTMILSQIINNGVSTVAGANSLQELSKKYLGITLVKNLQAVDNWQNKLTQEHFDYCLQDAKATFELYKILDEKIDNLYLRGTADREISVLPAVVEMSTNGIYFDYPDFEKELVIMKNKADELGTEIKMFLNNSAINLNSAVQLKQALESVMCVKLENTEKEYLSNFEGEYPVIDLLLKYKKMRKHLNSYGEKLRCLLDENNVLRGDWRLIGSDTGRMSCKKPTLQGMPAVSKKYFKSKADHSFIIADYSCIELRILAEITQDKKLVTAFNNGEDVHRKTAEILFDKTADDDVTDYERKVAKTVNFGIIYGMTRYGLMRRINASGSNKITLEAADIFIKKYLDNYKGVEVYQQKMMTADLIKTIGGRFWEDLTIPLKKYSRKRLNYPIQASAAEGFKNAVAEFLNRRKKDWTFKLLIHDEIVIQIPDSDIEEAKSILEQSMIIGMGKIIKAVPIVIDIKVNKYWDK